MLKIIGVVLDIARALLFRKWKRDDDPVEQAVKRKEAADQAIANGDSDAVNRILSERLRRPKSGGDSK